MWSRKISFAVSVLIIFNTSMHMLAQERNASIHDFESELRSIQDDLWLNPALLSNKYNQAFTDASLGYNKTKALGLHKVEDGTMNTSITFDAFSYKINTNSSLYGRATYNKTNTSNINWSTVSNHALLTPYIVADSIGGKSYSEVYSFEGIYNLNLKQSNLAIQFRYKSSEDYRKLDPRPKSTVSDLNITFGGATPINSMYKLGLSLNYYDYQQDHSVKAMRPGTGIKLFYLRGFGISDENFSTVITDNEDNYNIYEIKGYSFSIQVLPRGGSGFFHALSYESNKLQLFTAQNDIVNHLNVTKTHLSTGKSYQSAKSITKIRAFASYKNDKGFDYNYNYDRELLSSGQKYSSQLINGGFKLVWVNKIKNKKALYNIDLNYTLEKSDYQTTSAQKPKQEIESLNLKVLTGKNFNLNTSGLNFKLSCTYQYVFNSELVLSNLSEERTNSTLVLPNYEYLKNDKLILATDIRYDIDTNKNYGFYTKLEYSNMFIKTSDPQYNITLYLGITL